jgi:hypothetical protein
VSAEVDDQLSKFLTPALFKESFSAFLEEEYRHLESMLAIVVATEAELRGQNSKISRIISITKQPITTIKPVGGSFI